jgi:hypothetical protein
MADLVLKENYVLQSKLSAKKKNPFSKAATS